MALDFDDLDDAETTAVTGALERCTRTSSRWDGEIIHVGTTVVARGPGLAPLTGHELSFGTAVRVVEEATVAADSYLRLEAPYEGWVPKEYVSAVEPVDRGFPGADCDDVTDIRVPLGKRLRLYLISDVHVDYKKNREWLTGCIEQLDRDERFYNCLLLPGDVCHLEAVFEEVMGMLAAAFQEVFFCFGNHDVWVKGEKKGSKPVADSFQKLDRVHNICQQLHIYTSPVRLRHDEGDLLLLPLWSWYHSSWDTEEELPDNLRLPVAPGSRVMDYRMCKWGNDLEREPAFLFGDGGSGETSQVIAQHFSKRNLAWISSVQTLAQRDGGEILTFSHFCPRIELILEKRNTYDQFLPKVSGSAFLEQQIRSLTPAPACHVFGHTHVGWDAVLDDLRYVHWPLGNTGERNGQTRSQNDGGILLLRDGQQWAPRQFLHWSYNYDPAGAIAAKREPWRHDLAPWVSDGYVRMYPQMEEHLRSEGHVKEPDPVDGFAAYFPGGLENNSGAWWARHEGENDRWRCPPWPRKPQAFPCGDPTCLLCNHNLAASAKEVARTAMAGVSRYV